MHTHRRDERKRHEEALEKASAEGAERVKEAQEEAKREREALRRAHEKQVGVKSVVKCVGSSWFEGVEQRMSVYSLHTLHFTLNFTVGQHA